MPNFSCGVFHIMEGEPGRHFHVHEMAGERDIRGRKAALPSSRAVSCPRHGRPEALTGRNLHSRPYDVECGMLFISMGRDKSAIALNSPRPPIDMVKKLGDVEAPLLKSNICMIAA